MPVIESLSTASDDPLNSQIRLDIETGVRILRATVSHDDAPCRTWARSLRNRKAALRDLRQNKLMLFSYFLYNVFIN